jgi:uncharacterized protein
MQFLDVIQLPYVVLGPCVGVLIGMTGLGGGSLMTPLLILLFGVNPATAVGTDLLFAASTKTVGTLIHGVSHTIDWLIVGRLAAGSVPATAVTLLALSMLDLTGGEARRAITIILAGVLCLTSIALFFSKQVLLRHANYVRELDPTSISLLTDIAHAVPLTLLAGSGYWLMGSIAGNLLLGSIPGVVIGSYFAGRTANHVLRMVLAVVLIIVAVRLVL